MDAGSIRCDKCNKKSEVLHDFEDGSSLCPLCYSKFSKSWKKSHSNNIKEKYLLKKFTAIYYEYIYEQILNDSNIINKFISVFMDSNILVDLLNQNYESDDLFVSYAKDLGPEKSNLIFFQAKCLAKEKYVMDKLPLIFKECVLNIKNLDDENQFNDLKNHKIRQDKYLNQFLGELEQIGPPGRVRAIMQDALNSIHKI